jgi:hypothetical protein
MGHTRSPLAFEVDRGSWSEIAARVDALLAALNGHNMGTTSDE